VAADEPDDDSENGRAESTEQLWADVRIDPVEIALPGGVGYTLRAYRPPDSLTPAAAAGSAPASGADEDESEESHVDDYDAAAAAVLRRRRAESPEEEADEALPVADDDADEDDEAEGDEDSDEDSDDEDEELDEDEDDEPDEDEEDEEEEEEEEEAVEDVPIFLGRRGKVYLFHNAEKLVEYVRSGVENDMSQLDSWTDLVDRITPDDVVAVADDTYELDLVVENLRGGPDAWDPPLILRAGELARDLGYALRIQSVLAAMGTGSPLDDLDEALRAAEQGGISGFIARRKLRKLPAQQSALAWRTVIGKISSAADWRD
jgi:hypothetical protein